ncbi:acyl-CoA dehydratase activase [Thermodesulfobacteriota bacterium]
MVKRQKYFTGIDVGASRTKAAIMDVNKQLLGSAVIKSGTDFTASAKTAFAQAIEMAQVAESDMEGIISTGYGRKNVEFSNEARTEIACHAKGCYFYFPLAITIIDIGGQDNKIIKLDDNGRRISFKMNRKCAAGTGAFLEEISFRLDVPLEELNNLAEASRDMVELGSYCTVFSATEVLEKIRQGRSLSDIAKGLFVSVIKRVLEMESFSDEVVVTGGVVAHNPFLAKMLAEKIERPVKVPEFPQLTGAIGAALFAMDR